MSVKNYFDHAAHHFAYHKDPELFKQMVNAIGTTSQELTILDVGCGDGSFIRACMTNGVRAHFLGIDVSATMLVIAKKKMPKNVTASFLVCDSFNLPFRIGTQFEIIHISSVLHHLIARTRSRSILLVKHLLLQLSDQLSRNGSLFVDEGYYLSYIYPSISSRLIFYGLKMLNFLRLDISFIVREFQPGLEVNFLTKFELQKIIRPLGNAKVLSDFRGDDVKILYKIFFVKEIGHISYIVNRLENKGSEARKP